MLTNAYKDIEMKNINIDNDVDDNHDDNDNTSAL